MVSSEGIEGAKLEEPRADLNSGISSEAADIASHHLYAPHAEHEVAENRVFEEGEIGIVVTCPMEAISVRAECCASCDQEWPSNVPHELVRVVSVHQSEQRMNVGL